MLFEEFMKEVNDWLLERASVTADDIDDWPFYDAWDNGEDPEDVALEALFDSGFSVDD